MSANKGLDHLAPLDEVQLDLALGQQVLDPAAELALKRCARHFDANPLDRDLVDDIVEAVLNASSPTALRSTQRRRRFSRSFSNK
jgi:hypothetical protein